MHEERIYLEAGMHAHCNLMFYSFAFRGNNRGWTEPGTVERCLGFPGFGATKGEDQDLPCPPEASEDACRAPD